jgi:uncharacterized protein YndB with AHSA1/START domain
MSIANQQHATLEFERHVRASPAQVFTAYSSAAERMKWGVPSDTATFFYDEDNFRIGGRDVFRCGSKENPQYLGISTYQDITLNERIIWSERVESGGKGLMAALMTVTFEPEGQGTKLRMIAQVVSFDGASMIDGTRQGNNAALDNLVKAFDRRV